MNWFKKLFRRRVPVGWRIVQAFGTSQAYRSPRHAWHRLLNSLAQGVPAHIERSDDLGRTWYRVNDDGTKEGA